MKNKLARWMAVAALLAGPGAAWAVPVEWTFGPVDLGGNTTVSGSFTYDADTDTYTNVNISRSAGSYWPAATFTVRHQPVGLSQPRTVFFPAPIDFATTDLTGSPYLYIERPAFSNAGGTLTFEAVSGSCSNFFCNSFDGPLGTVSFSGLLPDTGTPGTPGTPASIPTLSEWGLFVLSSLMALAACVHVRRYRSNPRLPQPRV